MKRASNRVRQAIKEGRVPIGMEIMLGSERIIEMVGWAGFDFVQLDQEHAPFGFEKIESLIRAGDGVGLSSFVRVATSAEKDISRALDCGAHGVVVPQVKSAAEVKDALEAMYYAPKGRRGMCPVTRVARYDEDMWHDYLAWARDEVMLIPLIENTQALAEVDAICALPGIAVIGVGGGDLGQSLGEGAAGMSSEKVRAAFREVVVTAKRHGVLVKGMPVIGESAAASIKDLLGQGVGMIQYDADALVLSRICRDVINQARPLLSRRLSDLEY